VSGFLWLKYLRCHDSKWGQGRNKHRFFPKLLSRFSRPSACHSPLLVLSLPPPRSWFATGIDGGEGAHGGAVG